MRNISDISVEEGSRMTFDSLFAFVTKCISKLKTDLVAVWQ